MRNIQLINHGWNFWREGEREQTASVLLPHSASITPVNSSGGRNFQGICHYSRQFTARDMEGIKCFLRFDGAMGVAKFFFHKKLVGESYCGYIPFVIDASGFMAEGGELEVILDNRDNLEVPPGKPQDLLDFSYEGGLYRDVWLTTTSQLYITDPLLENQVAGGGVFVTFHNILEDSFEVWVKTHVKNDTNSEKQFKIRYLLTDREGTLVSQAEAPFILESGGDLHGELTSLLDKPQLWSPESPYLYELKVEVIYDGMVIDTMTVTTGIRTVKMTYENGVIFNGISRRISGGNYHQSWPLIGNAVPDNLLRRDAQKLRELGMKNIRAHYPLADAFIQACNRLGMTLIVSNPGWQHYKEGIFTTRLLDNIRNIVRWQRNNPCILMWEPIPNESVVPMEVQQLLHDAVHEEYPFDPCFTASDHGPTDVSYREYDPGMLQPGMEGYNPMKRYDNRKDCPLWIREYGDSPDNWDDQGCAWRTPRAWGDYAMLRAVERMLGLDAQLKGGTYVGNYNKENICGFGIWPAIEHNRGYHVNPCWGGFLDLFRLPKFTALFIKCQQSIEEAGAMVFIANWWTEVSPKDITVFSNAPKVRLYFNDRLVEEREPENFAVAHAPFIFCDIYQRFRERERCEIRVEAVEDGIVVATDKVKSPGVPYALKLEADISAVPVCSGGDMIAVRCLVLDKDGTITPRSADHQLILFEIEGEAELIGDGILGINPVYPEAGIASVLIRTKKNTRKINIRAQLYYKQGNTRVAIQPDIITLKIL